jgi:hypothetical protein
LKNLLLTKPKKSKTTMNPLLRNILAVIAGAIIGSIVNGSLVSVGGALIPIPEGASVATMQQLNESMALFEPKHFLFPWLAHALGTLAGAFVAALISTNQKLMVALIIGALFLMGGIYMVSILPAAPMWFNGADLLFAYLPMAWLGYKLAPKHDKK